MGEIPELASPSRERPKNVCQSVNTRREDAVRPSSFNQSMPLFTTSNCRPSVFCFFFKSILKLTNTSIWL